MEPERANYLRLLLEALRRHTDAGQAQWVNRGFDNVTFCYVRGEIISVQWYPDNPKASILLEVGPIQFIANPESPEYARIRDLLSHAVPDNETVVLNYYKYIKIILQRLE